MATRLPGEDGHRSAKSELDLVAAGAGDLARGDGRADGHGEDLARADLLDLQLALDPEDALEQRHLEAELLGHGRQGARGADEPAGEPSAFVRAGSREVPMAARPPGVQLLELLARPR